MISAKFHDLRAIRTLMAPGLVALGLVASTAAPTLAGSSGHVLVAGGYSVAQAGPFLAGEESTGTSSDLNARTSPLRIDTASEGYPCSNGVCSFPSGNIGTSYAAPITSTGGSGPTPYIWSVVAGSLPAGLSLTPSYGVYSAYVHGTPTTAQTSTFTLQVRDGVGHTAQQAFTLTINPSSPLVITFPSSCCPDGTVGTSYLQNFFLSGGVAPYIWSIATGQLPPGLSLAPSPPASITGTPTTAGTFTFTVRVTDSTGAHADEPGSIIVH